MKFIIVAIILIITPTITYAISEETIENINYGNNIEVTNNVNNDFIFEENITNTLKDRQELCKERDSIILDNKLDITNLNYNLFSTYNELEDLYETVMEIQEIDFELLCLISNSNYDFYKNFPIIKETLEDAKYNSLLIPIIEKTLY